MKTWRRSSVVQSQQIDATKRRAFVVVILPGLYERSSRWRRFDAYGLVLQLESICTSAVQISVLNVWQISARVFSLILSNWFFLFISLSESRGSNRQHALIRMVCFCSGLWSNREAGRVELQAAARPAAVLISLLLLCSRLRGDSWCQFRRSRQSTEKTTRLSLK